MMETMIKQSYFDTVIPQRTHESHKDDYGRVLAVCGAVGYTGAPFFAAQAAVRTGSGVVTLCTPEQIYPILACKLNEPVVYPVSCTGEGQLNLKGAQQIVCRANSAKAMLIGCGLGRSPETQEAIHFLVQHAACPIVLDADGINAMIGHIDILRNTHVPVILTPHLGEFSRLLGASHAGEREAYRFAQETETFVLLKSHRSAIFTPQGTVFRNTTGNPGMAKAGSGDVLAGVILSLCGQGLSPLDATCAGAFLHGLVGDLCANTMGEYGMTPTDMLEKIPYVLRRYNSREW